MVNVAEPAVQTFGKYQILERIATGGIAEIYKARLEGIGGFQRTFAIKRVLPHLSKNNDYVSMLVDEAKVAGLLSHANIVQILDLGQVDDVWYIAMEYVHGRDLGAVLERCTERGLVLPVPHATFVAIELLKALDYAHQRMVMRGGRQVPLDVIHRDVSPPNILIGFQGEVKLTDFGIARASLKVMETQAGIIKGRFDYMSPEQASGMRDALDQRSDLFSVGVVLYVMLTGTHPFAGESELDTLDAVRDGVYEPLRSRNPDVPVALEEVIDRALRADRDERFMTAGAFKDALDKFFHDAGFLFTQDNLATYMQGLFPESRDRRPSDEQDPFPADPHTEEVDLFDEDEGPTRVMDASLLTGLDSAPAARIAEDDPTIARSNPSGEQFASFIEPAEGDEAETVVQRQPTKPPKPRTAPRPERPTSLPPEPPTPPRVPPAPVVRRGVPVLVTALLCLGFLLLGVAVGLVLGAAAWSILGG